MNVKAYHQILKANLVQFTGGLKLRIDLFSNKTAKRTDA